MSRRLVLALALTATLGARVAQADDDLEPRYACKPLGPNTKLSVTFRPETDLKDLVAWMLGFTCKNVVFDAGVQKYATKITVIAPNQLTPKQAFQLFVDAVESTGLVVVVKPDTIVIKLGPNMPRDCAVAATGPAPAESGFTPDELDTAIKVIDETHREVTRALRDRVMANPAAAVVGARITPAVKNSQPVGVKLYAIRPTSLIGKLGFTNGDTVISWNGMLLTDPEKALEIYPKLRAANKIDVEIERRGKPLTLSYTIK